MTGTTPKANNVIAVEDRGVFVRNDKGIVNYFTAEQYGDKKQADLMGMEYGEFVVNGGVKWEDPVDVVHGGVKYRGRTGFDAINQKPVREQNQISGEVTPAEQRKQAEKEVGIKLAFKGQDEKNDLFKNFKTLVLEDEVMAPAHFAKEFLDPHYPGQVVILHGVKKSGDWYNWLPLIDPDELYLSDKFLFKTIPGQRLEVKTLRSQTDSGSGYETVVLDPAGEFRDTLGRLIPKLSQAYPIPGEVQRILGGK